MEHSNSPGHSKLPSGVMDRVKESATAQLSSQKERATDGLGSIATAVRRSSEPLRENKQDFIAEYVEKAADQIEQFSSRLRERDINELVDDAQQFARRRPALFIGAAFAVGVAAARFLKSSSPDGVSGMAQRYGRDDRHRYGGGRTEVPRYGSTAPYTPGGM